MFRTLYIPLFDAVAWTLGFAALGYAVGTIITRLQRPIRRVIPADVARRLSEHELAREQRLRQYQRQ